MSKTMGASVQPEKQNTHTHANSNEAAVPTTRDEIIRAATELFRDQGYNNTSMTAIARAVDLDQSSMYYWFKSKEQVLEGALMAHFDTCKFRGKIFHASASCSSRLFALIFRRTYKYCSVPIDVYAVETAEDKKPGLFERFFTELESFKMNLYSLIKEGMDTGEFFGIGAAEATNLVMALIMNQQHTFHRQSLNKVPLLAIEQGIASEDVRDWALQAARIGTAMLTANRNDVTAIEQEAASHEWLENA